MTTTPTSAAGPGWGTQGLGAFAVPQLVTTTHRHIDTTLAACRAVDQGRSATLSAIERAARAGRIASADVPRLTAALGSDGADIGRLYLDSLADPAASELAGILLGLLASRPPRAAESRDLVEDALIVGFFLLTGSPPMALGAGLAIISQHVHVTID